jgi:proteic killer suppression protein
MIKTLRHKGLKRFYSTGSTAGIQADHAKRLRMQLTALDTATSLDDMEIPGFRLHPLKGKASGRWSVWVRGNQYLVHAYLVLSAGRTVVGARRA